ncbi:MAG: hypothetical protein WAU63_01565, partial [Methylovirgula sp.]
DLLKGAREFSAASVRFRAFVADLGKKFGRCAPGSDREMVPEAIGKKSRGVRQVLVLYFRPKKSEATSDLSSRLRLWKQHLTSSRIKLRNGWEALTTSRF